MQLSRDAISEFQRIYKTEFGEELSDGEAEECALRVLRLYALLLRDEAGRPASSGSTDPNFDSSQELTVP